MPGSSAKLGARDEMVMVIVSVLRADWAVLRELKDSRVSVYSPTCCPSVFMYTSLELSYSIIDTKLWGFDAAWRRLISSVVPIVNSEYMFGTLKRKTSPCVT